MIFPVLHSLLYIGVKRLLQVKHILHGNLFYKWVPLDMWRTIVKQLLYITMLVKVCERRVIYMTKHVEACETGVICMTKHVKVWWYIWQSMWKWSDIYDSTPNYSEEDYPPIFVNQSKEREMSEINKDQDGMTNELIPESRQESMESKAVVTGFHTFTLDDVKVSKWS